MLTKESFFLGEESGLSETFSSSATKVIMITTMRQSDNFSIPSGRVIHAARVQNRSRMNFESLTALLDEVAVEVVCRELVVVDRSERRE